MEYNVHTLKNGIRILYVPQASNISHTCFLIHTGSRDEEKNQNGMAHFIEHLIFKHTEKRNTNQILNRLESVGADLNAYTTKEYTCIHASHLQPYLDRTVELFNDIVFHSTFPQNEIEKEKGVILDEIASYQDQPEEAIVDNFEDLLFKGHALGRNILGTAESVSTFSKMDIRAFIQQNYRTDEMVLAVLGNYTFKKVLTIAEKHLSYIPENTNQIKRIKPLALTGVYQKEQKSIAQSHCMMGIEGYSFHHPYKTGLLLLNNWFGGMGMSSILNLQIREKHGIAYTVESNYSPLSDTGIFSIYFGTDIEKTEKAIRLIQKEMKKLREKPISLIQLHKAQNKFIGQIALGEENRIGLIIAMAKSLIDYGFIDSLATIFNKVRAVSTTEINHIIHEMLDESRWNTLIFEPEED